MLVALQMSRTRILTIRRSLYMRFGAMGRRRRFRYIDVAVWVGEGGTTGTCMASDSTLVERDCRGDSEEKTTLESLPSDVLCLIGARVAGLSRDVTLSCKDAAACSMAGSGAILVVASATWKQCAKIAETIPTVPWYRTSWGAKYVHAQILKRELLPLALTCPDIRPSSTMADMTAMMNKPVAVGKWCPILRPTALFLLQISLTFMTRSPAAPALRDKDLSFCRSHRRNGVYGASLVRLRDALAAPSLDREAIVRSRIAANEELDREFGDAGFVRGFQEDDIELRRRLHNVDEWASRVEPHPHIHWLATSVARQNRLEPTVLDNLVRIDAAFKSIGTSPERGLGYTYTHPLMCVQRDLLTEARGYIYDMLQLRHMGIVLFRLDPGLTMPTLAREEIIETTNALILHRVLRTSALTYPTFTAESLSARNMLTDALLESTTLEEADTALANFALMT